MSTTATRPTNTTRYSSAWKGVGNIHARVRNHGLEVMKNVPVSTPLHWKRLLYIAGEEMRGVKLNSITGHQDLRKRFKLSMEWYQST